MPIIKSISDANLPRTGLEVTKLFSCSTQLSIKFQLLIKTEMLRNKEFLAFKLPNDVFIMLINVKRWHFNIYKQNKFRAQLN